MRPGCAALAALALAATAHAQPLVAPLSQGRAGTAPAPGWEAFAFARIDRHTRYELVPEDGSLVVAATAEASASAWIHRLDVPLAQASVLRWRWKGLELPPGADTRTKAGDDAVARIYVTFRYAPERLAWPLRLLYDLIHAIYGEAPPHATLMYAWDASAPVGAAFASPYTDRVRTLVVESGPARRGQWLAYERDLAADYRAAFGDDPPPLSGVAIMTDADNTRTHAVARYGDVSLSRQ